MQVRPLFVGLAVAVAAAAFYLALMITMVSEPFHHGLAPSVQQQQRAAQR
jgi:hypothetical protein